MGCHINQLAPNDVAFASGRVAHPVIGGGALFPNRLELPRKRVSITKATPGRGTLAGKGLTLQVQGFLKQLVNRGYGP